MTNLQTIIQLASLLAVVVGGIVAIGRLFQKVKDLSGCIEKKVDNEGCDARHTALSREQDQIHNALKRIESKLDGSIANR